MPNLSCPGDNISSLILVYTKFSFGFEGLVMEALRLNTNIFQKFVRYSVINNKIKTNIFASSKYSMKAWFQELYAGMPTFARAASIRVQTASNRSRRWTDRTGPIFAQAAS